MRRRTPTSPAGRPRISASPARREDELHQQLERGRLAGAVRPEEPEHVAGGDVERQPLQRAVGPRAPEPDHEVLGQLTGADRRLRHALDAGRRRHCPPAFFSSISMSASIASGFMPRDDAAVQEERRRGADAQRGARRRLGLHLLNGLRILRVVVGDAGDGPSRRRGPSAGLNSSWCMKNQSVSLSNVARGYGHDRGRGRGACRRMRPSASPPRLHFGFSGKCFSSYLKSFGRSLYFSRIASYAEIRPPARRTLIVVELHQQDFRAVVRVRHLDLGLHVPPSLELAALGPRASAACCTIGRSSGLGKNAMADAAPPTKRIATTSAIGVATSAATSRSDAFRQR